MPSNCHGAEDQDGNPICEGPDVRDVLVNDQGIMFTTQWCADCRNIAHATGMKITMSSGEFK